MKHDDLIGIPGIAKIIGLTAGSVRQMRTHGKLPTPDAVLGPSKRWKVSTILVWDEARTKRYDNRKGTNG